MMTRTKLFRETKSKKFGTRRFVCSLQALWRLGDSTADIVKDPMRYGLPGLGSVGCGGGRMRHIQAWPAGRRVVVTVSYDPPTMGV